jgi:hypothetical protein
MELDLQSFYVPASYIMYLSDFCRFLLLYVLWVGEEGGEGGWRRGGLESGGLNVYCMGTVSVLTVPS